MQHGKRTPSRYVFVAVVGALLVGAASTPEKEVERGAGEFSAVANFDWGRADFTWGRAEYDWGRAVAEFDWGRALAGFEWGRAVAEFDRM